MERDGTINSMDTNLSKRVEEEAKEELQAQQMQASVSGASGDVETDDSLVSLQVA